MGDHLVEYRVHGEPMEAARVTFVCDGEQVDAVNGHADVKGWWISTYVDSGRYPMFMVWNLANTSEIECIPTTPLADLGTALIE